MNIEAIVTEANLAPSVHNTQPTRWTQDGSAALVLSLDKSRLLQVGDPTGRDARLSMGTALYGTRIAADRAGLGVRGVEMDTDSVRIEFGADPENTWNKEILSRRMTWRHAFVDKPASDLSVVANRDDTSLTSDPSLIDSIAILNDEISFSIMRERAFRDELRYWMRLSKRHPGWSCDGLNATALGMSGIEAVGAGLVLRSPAFEVLAGLGLGRLLTGEAAKTRTAHCIAAFYRPEGEDPLVSGEAFYAMWLMLTAAGQAGWPMAALADDPDAAREVCALMGVPQGHRLINVLRVGPLPKHAPPKARLSSAELIVNR